MFQIDCLNGKLLFFIFHSIIHNSSQIRYTDITYNYDFLQEDLFMLIKNGYIIDPASGRAEFADLQISDGKIFSIGQHLSVSPSEEIIDASGSTPTFIFVILASPIRKIFIQVLLPPLPADSLP